MEGFLSLVDSLPSCYLSLLVSPKLIWSTNQGERLLLTTRVSQFFIWAAEILFAYICSEAIQVILYQFILPRGGISGKRKNKHDIDITLKVVIVALYLLYEEIF